MKIRVWCRSSYRADQEPTAVSLGGERLDVLEHLDAWQGPDHRYFKIRVAGDVILIVRNDLDTGDWELTMYDGSLASG